jgi:hypothetical protein
MTGSCTITVSVWKGRRGEREGCAKDAVAAAKQQPTEKKARAKDFEKRGRAKAFGKRGRAVVFMLVVG